MRNLFEIFVQPEANQIQNHLMIIVVVVVAKGHMEMEVGEVMGAHMEMIMVLNQVIVPNLQMVMDQINIIHIIIITMVTMIGMDKKMMPLPQTLVDQKWFTNFNSPKILKKSASA